MKEDLKLYGNELNYFTTYFNIGYCVMLIPSQVILTYVRPSYWLPGLEIAWGILTGLIATVSNAHQVYAIRAFLGLCESSAWPGMMTLLMHWYTPLELAKRMGFYHSCQAIGSMMSGAIQAAISSTLEGHSGIAGWRWLFIINAIITVVWGFAGFFMLPDYPNRPNPRAFWFSDTHAEIAMNRLSRHGRAEPKAVSWEGAKRTFSTWVTYFFAVLYICTVIGNYGYTFFGLFLKSLKNADGTRAWTTAQVNAIPIGGSAIQVVFVWIWAFISDHLQARWPLIIVQVSIALIPGIIMSIWTRHPEALGLAAAYSSYFLNYMVLGTAPLIFAWLADILPQDSEARPLIVGAAIAGDYAIAAWSNILMWPAKQAPYYRYGWESAIALLTTAIIMVCVLRWIDGKYLRKQRTEYAAALEGDIMVGTNELGGVNTRDDAKSVSSVGKQALETAQVATTIDSKAL
ncbi:hypothetical protein RBB50_007820 [Rhinocladiella similis]